MKIVAGTMPSDSGLTISYTIIVLYTSLSPAGVPFLLISFPKRPAFLVNSLTRGMSRSVDLYATSDVKRMTAKVVSKCRLWEVKTQRQVPRGSATQNIMMWFNSNIFSIVYPEIYLLILFEKDNDIHVPTHVLLVINLNPCVDD